MTTELKTHTDFSSISREELCGKMKRNEPIQILNVLSPEYYNLGFIKGSRKIPLEELDRRMNELDKNKEVITYCAGVDCPASLKAAEKLAAKGFNVRAYEGGIKEWQQTHLPVE